MCLERVFKYFSEYCLKKEKKILQSDLPTLVKNFILVQKF